MMMKKSAVSVFVATMMLAATNAFAGGFLADTFIKPFSPEAAAAADEWNKNAGKPVERGVAAGADAVFPGAGPVVNGGFAIQQGLSRGLPDEGQATGNFCVTAVGRIGPGPVNPLGSPCNALTDFGWTSGVVGR